MATADQWPDIDVIVGIARSGCVIATALSYLMPKAHLQFATKNGASGQKVRRYDFSAQPDARKAALSRRFELGDVPEKAEQILLVDDVVTSGQTMSTVRTMIQTKAPNAKVICLAYAADIPHLAKFGTDTTLDLHYAILIDNSKVWINFPWTLKR